MIRPRCEYCTNNSTCTAPSVLGPWRAMCNFHWLIYGTGGIRVLPTIEV